MKSVRVTINRNHFFSVFSLNNMRDSASPHSIKKQTGFFTYFPGTCLDERFSAFFLSTRDRECPLVGVISPANQQYVAIFDDKAENDT